MDITRRVMEKWREPLGTGMCLSAFVHSNCVCFELYEKQVWVISFMKKTYIDSGRNPGYCCVLFLAWGKGPAPLR